MRSLAVPPKKNQGKSEKTNNTSGLKSANPAISRDQKIMATRRIGNVTEIDDGVDAKAIKRMTAKKVIYVEIDDEVTAIYDRIKPLKMKNIYIVVPRRAMLFQSIINLKILKRKAEDLEKNIYIITNDPNGIHLAKQIGLTVYDKLEGHDHPSLVSGKFLEDQQNITPLKASVNAFEDDTPMRQTEKKLSISELIRTGKKRGLAIIAKNFTSKIPQSKEQKKQNEKGKLVLVAPNRQALISLIVVSLIILLTITYIALPGATITLTPKSDVLETAVNVVLADAETNQAELDTHPIHTISSTNMVVPIKKVFTYPATGNDFKGTNAHGMITVINSSDRDWTLVVKTQFQTSNNLIFRSKSPIVIKAQKNGQPGTADVEVEADPIDGFNQVVGDKGNIGPTRFIIPKISPDSQKLLYAESKAQMAGGTTIVTKFITKEDLDAAQKKMEADLKDSAQVELQAAVQKQNTEQKTNLVLLVDRKAIQTGTPKVTIPSSLEGQKLDSFEVQGEITASGTAYDRNEMMNMLKAELKLKKNPEKRLVHIQEDSLTYRVVEFDAINKKVKITATIKGIEEFEISPDKENGERLIKQIKEHVIGKDIREARDYIQNLPAIDKVKIDSWPAWAPTMPGVPDNIKVEVEEAQQ